MVPPAATPGDGTARPASAEALAALAADFDKTPDVIVARVGGTPITLGMVADRVRGLAPAWGNAPARQTFDVALSGIIQTRLLALKAKELGIDKTPSVQREITFATDGVLANALMRNIGADKITPEALRVRFEKEYAGKPGPEEVWLRVIVTPTEAQAQEALTKIREGMDFASAVTTFSQDASKQNGGDLGYVTVDRLPQELSAVAFGLSTGEMSASPVLATGGWYIVEVEGRRQRGAPTFEEVAPTLRAELTKEALLAYIKRVQDSANIEVYGPSGAEKDMTARLR
jgi:peptidyl-prolyl cis-trans isomerase C